MLLLGASAQSELVEPRRSKAAVGPNLNLDIPPHSLSDGLHDSLQNGHEVRGKDPLLPGLNTAQTRSPCVGIEDQQRMQNVVSVIPVVEGEPHCCSREMYISFGTKPPRSSG